jgi:hypothetical protein
MQAFGLVAAPDEHSPVDELTIETFELVANES